MFEDDTKPAFLEKSNARKRRRDLSKKARERRKRHFEQKEREYEDNFYGNID